MNSDELLKAALYYDVDELRRDPDGADWIRLFQLFPGALRPDAVEGRGAIKVAHRGLAAEMSGDADRAAKEYRALSRRKGKAGLLGALLMAWQASASEADFDRVVEKLGTDDEVLIASVHCRLMSWAIDHGWRERAFSHYRIARKHAHGDLAEVLARAGDWFEQSIEVRWGYRFTEPLVLCKPAVDAMKGAADDSLRRSFEESVQSPWTRVIRFGGEVAGLRSVVAAELQASWVGAIWHLPAIRQQYARISLPHQADPKEVSLALGYWIRGGGKNIPRVLQAFEGRLTPDSLNALLDDHLHEGRSVKRPSEWMAVCHALWDQLPEPLCLSLIESYEPTFLGAPHDDDAGRVALFASLVMRAPTAWGEKVSTISDEQLATVVRLLHPTLVKFVPKDTLKRCVRTFLDTQAAFDADWAGHGWTTAGVMWKELEPPDDALTAELRAAIPESQAPMVALNARGLVNENLLIRARDDAVRLLETDLSNAKKGMFVRWGQNPASQLARTLIALGRATNRSASVLIAIVNANECSSEQRHAALRALTSLVEEGVVRPSLRDISPEPAGRAGQPFQESLADVRLERITRVGLRIRLSATQKRTGEILEATRDPDPRVRETALSTATWLMSTRRTRSPALETAVFGGLYDPEPAVQSDAAEAIARFGLHDASLDEVAMHRIEDSFALMHRDVRAAVARALSDRGREDGVYGRLRASATIDRSFVVRFSVMHDTT